MNGFVLMCDSGCDLPESFKKEMKVTTIELPITSSDGVNRNGMPSSAFYFLMKNGITSTTSALNVEGYNREFSKELVKGNDILYIAFSSGLSSTCDNAVISADLMMKKYPERKITVVDSLSASTGCGLLLWLVYLKKCEGKTLEEVTEYAERIKGKICHWFTVDDLKYLKRGGRIDPAAAFVATLLNIKPVMHTDEKGKLVGVSKVHGRMLSLKALCEKFGELCENPQSATVFINHADCPEDAELLKMMLKDKYSADVRLIAEIGPVIGSHSGPGTIAIFFLGKER